MDHGTRTGKGARVVERRRRAHAQPAPRRARPLVLALPVLLVLLVGAQLVSVWTSSEARAERGVAATLAAPASGAADALVPRLPDSPTSTTSPEPTPAASPSPSSSPSPEPRSTPSSGTSVRSVV